MNLKSVQGFIIKKFELVDHNGPSFGHILVAFGNDVW